MAELLNSFVFVLIFYAGIVAGGDAKRGYMVTAPKVFLTGTDVNVCLTLHNVNTDGEVEINLLSEHDHVLSKDVHLIENGKSFCTKFRVPNVPNTIGFLSVKGSLKPDADGRSGYSFEKQKKVLIKQKSSMTFVQTDKPIYKPGQTVKFRILRLTTDLKPLLDKVPQIWIEDPSGIRISQWLNTTPHQGLVDLEMPLSTEPTIGSWNIKADVGSYIQVQSFEVDKYVLPKFEVKITPPPYIVLTDSSAKWKVCAEYSHGKLVEGTAKVRIQLCSEYGHERNPIFLEPYDGEIKGCREVGTTLIDQSYKRQKFKIVVTAEVTEKGTGETMNTTAESAISRSPFSLKFDTSEHYKPGIPFAMKLITANPDGTPAANRSVKVTVSAGKPSVVRKVIGSMTLKSNDEGIISLTVGPVDSELTYVHLEAESSISEVQDYQLNVAFRKPASSLYLQSWYSPSSSYIQINPMPTVICGEVSTFTVRTSNIPSSLRVHYQVMSRGNIVLQDYILVESSLQSEEKNESSYVFGHPDQAGSRYQHFHLKIDVLPEMSPISRLLIFYVRQDGEVVTDSLKFTVKQCMNNNVRVWFESDEVTPAAETSLHIRGSPHSLCAIGSVDKSVHYLGSSNQLTETKVFDEITGFNINEKTEPLQKTQDKCRRFPGYRGYGRYKRHYLSNPEEENYVDAVEAFDHVGMVVITDLLLETRPCPSYPMEDYFGDIPQNFIRMGEAEIPGFPIPLMARGPIGKMNSPALQYSQPEVSRPKIVVSKEVSTKPKPKQKVEIRNYFPETWLWELHTLSSTGSLNLAREVPHTITDWISSGFCVSSVDGFGIAPPVTLKVFQPFFLTYTLPYSVKRGETVPVIVSVSNYLQDCLSMKVSLEESTSFSLASNSSSAKMCICGDTIATHKFVIRPKVLGKVNITVYAYTTPLDICIESSNQLVAQVEARDAITKQLLVEAEGFKKEFTSSRLICPENRDSDAVHEVDLLLPTIVEGSARAYVSVVGDIMAPALQGLERLVRLPVGCGEQNMVLFAPNIFVMQYLRSTNQLTPVLEHKLISYMRTGYQRQLNYKHDDGAYSAFGKSDREGSLWLTAFVIKSFSQAKPYILIDQMHFDKSISWILGKQWENGCFPFFGKLLDKKMKGGLRHTEESFAGLTAYVLIAFLESGIPPTSKVVENAFYCLRAETNPETYTLALSTYAAILAKKANISGEYLDELMKRGTETDELLYWEDNSEATTIEIGGYAVMCLTSVGGSKNLIRASKIIRWLAKKQNPNGGFVSTQDTIVALQAISQFAIATQGNKTQIKLNVEADDLKHSFRVTDDNRLLMQTIQIPELPTVVTISAAGSGCALVQTVLRYNVEKTEGSDAFDVTVATRAVGAIDTSCKRQRIEICTKYKMEDGESNMAVIETEMLSGFEPDKSSLEKLSKSVIKRWEVEGNTVNMYFDQLTRRRKCFSFFINQVVEVEDVKPGIVTVYDYYEPELSVETDYQTGVACDFEDKLPELDEDELAGIEEQIIPDGVDPFQMIAFDSGESSQTIPDTVSGTENKTPVDEVVPDPVQAHLFEVRQTQRKRESVYDQDPLANFVDIDSELNTPDEIEGPMPIIMWPPNFGNLTDNGCPHYFPEPSALMMYCKAQFAFTAVVKSVTRNKLKMIHFFESSDKPVRQTTKITYRLPTNCDLPIKQDERLLIFGTSNDVLTHAHSKTEGSLNMNGNVYLMSVPKIRDATLLVKDVLKGLCARQNA